MSGAHGVVVTAAAGGRPVRGRQRELAMIDDALARAAAGQPSTVVLVGEPGIGKSRLAIEAAAVAARAGFTTLWGRAWEAGGAPPYWPWRQLCEGFDRDGPIAQLWERRTGASTDADQARFELFDAVARALARRASDAPLLCVLDDLHAADVPSLELVVFATRHLRTGPIVWLLTWRDAEGTRTPVREPLARIAREATVVPLAALTDVDANQLIDDVRRDADIELRGRLLHATRGNPLFLLETLAALATGHVQAAELERLPIAQGIATIVADRLAPLAAQTRALAEAASVVGRDVALASWAIAADRDAESVRREATALVAAGLLVALGHDRWRFGHDLVREAIYRAAGDVVEIHGRLAREIDARVVAGDASLVGERAHHGLHARGDVRTVLGWTIAAADYARSQCAYEEALAVVELAIACLGSVAQRDPALQLARGSALLDLGATEKASEAFTTAMALARKAGDPKLAVAAVLGLGARYILGDHPHDLIALIDQAAAELPPGERELHARLLARKAAALTPAPEPELVLDMAREAQRLIEDSTDDAARLEVAVAVGATFTDFAHPRERAPINETVIRLARARGDRALELRGLSRLACDHIQAGDFARADSVLVTRDALARSLVQPRFAWMEPLFRSMRAMIRGDLATCDAAVDEAERFATADPNAARACAVHRAWLLLYSDRIDALRVHEPVFANAIRTMPSVLGPIVRMVMQLRSGQIEDARLELAALATGFDNFSINGLTTIGEVVAEIGTDDRRRATYDELAPFADVYTGFGLFGLVCGPPVAATLGDLAAALGDLDRARAHFESAIAMSTANAAYLGRAWSRYGYARVLAKLGDPAAARVRDDAVEDATRIGSTSLVARCRAISVAASVTPTLTPAVTARMPWSIALQAGSWQVTNASRTFLVPNLRGMAMLARLAASPHVEIHSLELVSGGPAAEPDGGDAGELLDAQARAAYRKRIDTLAELIEAAEARGDTARAEAAYTEHETLLKELSRAVGLGGKVRRAGAAGERARIVAQRRLREAIRKVAELDDELGRHLAKAIRTGTFCAYRP